MRDRLEQVARREVGLALGYGTDDGARGEAAYRDRNLLIEVDGDPAAKVSDSTTNR